MDETADSKKRLQKKMKDIIKRMPTERRKIEESNWKFRFSSYLRN